MKALVLGGTRFMGKHLVNALLETGWEVTLATRGLARDDFGNRVFRIKVERTDFLSLRKALSGKWFDAAFDSLAYCSNDVAALLDTLECGRYVQTSSASVYEGVGNGLHLDTREEEFDPSQGELVLCGRADFPYEEVKRQAERAIAQKYPAVPAVMVRFPYVIGPDDYTDRLYFYVEHIVKGRPMFVDDLSVQRAFVRSDEAGKFLAFLGKSGCTGAVNGASAGTVSVAETVAYVEGKTGKKAVFAEEGDPAPYNGDEPYSLRTERAGRLGYRFTPLRDWFWKLLDTYIERASMNGMDEN